MHSFRQKTSHPRMACHGNSFAQRMSGTAQESPAKQIRNTSVTCQRSMTPNRRICETPRITTISNVQMSWNSYDIGRKIYQQEWNRRSSISTSWRCSIASTQEQKTTWNAIGARNNYKLLPARETPVSQMDHRHQKAVLQMEHRSWNVLAINNSQKSCAYKAPEDSWSGHRMDH